MFKTLQSIILASESPRRKGLLLSVGLDFKVYPSRIEESAWPDGTAGPSKSPAGIAQRWAGLKAKSVAALHPDSWILGADTIVVLDSRIYGKPSSRAEAIRMLVDLNGRTHEVITGMCLIKPGGIDRRSGSVITRVRFKTLSMAEIEAYVRTGEPMDKAGAYGIQGIGAFLVSAVEGSYTNVVGLPLCEVVDWLVSESIIEPA
ncbi:Maf-like protein Gmet_0895 [Syntrophobacter sp. SbD1]|nr:Maf-like protein Gmet_0895 [Syntrophobacter sp. SbD1]